MEGLFGTEHFRHNNEMNIYNPIGTRGRSCAAYSAWVGLWLLLALAAFSHTMRVNAQQNPASSRFPTSLEVTGVVVDLTTGKPISGALVTTVRPKDWHRRSLTPQYSLVPPRPQPATPQDKVPGPEDQQVTDANGRFQFTAMGFAERKEFYVSKPGYLAPGSNGSFISGISVAVMPAMGELRFALMPEAEVSGKVTASSETELPTMFITLYRVEYMRGRPHWIYFDNQRTDASGRYQFAGLPAGTYFVVSQWLLDNDPVRLDSTTCNVPFLPAGGFAPEAEPGVLDFQKATPIVLTEGQHAVADLELQHQVFHPVTIPRDPKLNSGIDYISDRNGRLLQIPQARCTRFLFPSRDGPNWTINLPDGSYIFEQRGAYSLTDPFETGGAKQPEDLGGYAEVTVAGKPVTVTLPALRDSARPKLQIRAHRETTPPTPDGSVKDVCKVQNPGGVSVFGKGAKSPPTLQVGLEPVNSFGGEVGAWGETQKSADLYEITTLRPGRYWVQTRLLESGYVSAITMNGVNLMQHPLEIGANQTSSPLDITIRNDCGRIHFGKPWSKPPAGAVLADPVGITDAYYELLVPQFSGATPTGQFSAERTLIERGREVSVSLGNLPPGHYKVFQTFDENAVAYFSHAELEKRLGPGNDVWLKPGEQLDLNIHDLPPW